MIQLDKKKFVFILNHNSTTDEDRLCTQYFTNFTLIIATNHVQ